MRELTLKDIKVGKKYKVKPEYKDKCGTGNSYDFVLEPNFTLGHPLVVLADNGRNAFDVGIS